MALAPIGVPVRSPRTVSVKGVNGWYSANWRSPVGIVTVGTKPLPRNGNSVKNMGVLLAVSTLFAARPSAVASQINAKVNNASMPKVASQANGLAVGRKPDRK